MKSAMIGRTEVQVHDDHVATIFYDGLRATFWPPSPKASWSPHDADNFSAIAERRGYTADSAERLGFTRDPVMQYGLEHDVAHSFVWHEVGRGESLICMCSALDKFEDWRANDHLRRRLDDEEHLVGWFQQYVCKFETDDYGLLPKAFGPGEVQFARLRFLGLLRSLDLRSPING